MSNLATVQRLNVTNVYNDILTYLGECESEKTKNEYMRDIKEFFVYFHGDVSLENLKREHVECVKTKNGYEKMMNKDIISYKNHLMKKNANSTVIRKISSVRTLYNFFQANEYNVSPIIFKLKKMQKKSNSYGIFSKDEVEMMANAAKNSPAEDILAKFKYEVLSAYYYTATMTSIRISALLSAEWNSVYWSDKDNIHLITIKDKRDQTVTRGLDKWLYDILKNIKDRSGSDLLFPHLKIDWVEKQTKRLIKELGFPESRHLKVHSFRKTAINYEVDTTGNYDKARLQSGHQSLQVLVDHYRDANVNYSGLAGVTMFKELDETIFDKVKKDELLKMLKEINIGAYRDLGLKIQEMYGGV